MAYFVQTLPALEAYFASFTDLHPDLLLEMLDDVERALADNADFYLERFPVAHESTRFEYDTTILHGDRLHIFRFLVDATERASGVVRIVYADNEAIP